MHVTTKTNELNGFERIAKILEEVEISDTHPRMIEVLVEGKTYQAAFCFAHVVADIGQRVPLLLCTIIGGIDSTVQSIKAAIDNGISGLKFGTGEKSSISYQFESQFQFYAEKGKYTTFPITINGRKAIIMVHDLVREGSYTFSFEKSPAAAIRNVIGGKKYGIGTLKEWEEPIYQRLLDKKGIETVPCYYDKKLFKNFQVLKFNFNEDEMDHCISEMVKEKEIFFPEAGCGTALEEVNSLTDYMLKYAEVILEKVSHEVKPSYNPLIDLPLEHFLSYKTQLFPTQAHVSTALAKHLCKQKSVILQGEMSTGKSKMMTAVADGYHHLRGKSGYFGIILCPTNLTKKWPEEIKSLIDAEVHVIKKSAELIRYHQSWIDKGRPKPTKPIYFVISYETMRDGCAIEPAVEFQYIKTKNQTLEGKLPYRYGYYCPNCGSAHQIVENESTVLNEEGKEVIQRTTHSMDMKEFGASRRILNSSKPQNAFCSECGESLWKHYVPTRYSCFKEWTVYEEKLLDAIRSNNQYEVNRVKLEQPEIRKRKGNPRKVAAIQYIKRKMKNFFDIAVIDELHKLKGSNSAQGNSLAGLVAASKKCIAGTGTLFGGKAEDIYSLLWRLFPHEMVQYGFKYNENMKFNYEFGNVEKITYSKKGSNKEFNNKNSHGGILRAPSLKVKPGISPFILGMFLLHNTVLLRLLDVWMNPVELVDVPTILVPMNKELEEANKDMTYHFEKAISMYKSDGKSGALYLSYSQTGVSYPDNPFTYPDITLKTDKGRELIWSPHKLDPSNLLPKEQEIIKVLQQEVNENRPSIVYVCDTGSSKAGRDVQPRLKKVFEENVEGANVAILRSNTVAADSRTEWIAQKVNNGVNIIICSIRLVEVGIDLIMTPTIMFYQFDWSMFIMAQAAKRAFRIGQEQECRLFYFAYSNSFQEAMAQLIAEKNRASQAINGTVSSEGLSAMLGDSGDLQTALIKQIQNGKKIKGTTEEWVTHASIRARELLNRGSNNTESLEESVYNSLILWMKKKGIHEVMLSSISHDKKKIVERILKDQINGFKYKENELRVDEIVAFGTNNVSDSDVYQHLYDVAAYIQFDDIEIVTETKKSIKKKRKIAEGQLAMNLFDF